jgi:predicted Fe-Mo cluster-binding NifX family protein
MKTALTVWEDRISPVFDSARMLLVAEIENKKVTGRRYEPFDSDLSSHLAERLAELDIAVLICGAISELPANMIEAAGIKLIPFITGIANEVLYVYAKGIPIIPAFLMPGCGHKRRRHAGSGAGKKAKCPFYSQKEVIYMPKGDGKGPQGRGPGTGKGQGGCKSGRGGGASSRNSGQGQGRRKWGGQGRGKGGRQGG